ncbi:MAG: hypothetical protein LBO62_02035 [Endomicrobium sp.]|jgi:hypothetical protein|nr:hypothetical protein [Endomicrobium sp.]
MYDINLVGKVVLSSERNMKVVRFLKVFSFFLTLALFGVLALSSYTFLNIQETTGKITILRGQIEDSRRISKAKDTENQWTEYYYKILAIKDIISRNTKTGLLLRDIGLYMPDGDKIAGIELTKDNQIIELAKIKKFTPEYDLLSYAGILKESYSRSSLIGEPIVVDANPVTVTVNGQKIDAAKVVIQYTPDEKK